MNKIGTNATNNFMKAGKHAAEQKLPERVKIKFKALFVGGITVDCSHGHSHEKERWSCLYDLNHAAKVNKNFAYLSIWKCFAIERVRDNYMIGKAE